MAVVPESSAISRWQFFRHLRYHGIFKVFVVIWLALSILSTLPVILPASLAKHLALFPVLSKLPWYGWLLGLLMIVLIGTFESAYRSHNSGLRQHASEIRGKDGEIEKFRKEADELKRHLEALTVPRLQTTFEMMNIAPAGEADRDTLLIVGMSISNTGAPTIGRNFGFKVKLSDGREPPVTSVTPGNKDIQVTMDDGQEMQLLIDQYLPRRGSSTPIPHNGMAAGFLLYKVDGVSVKEFSKQPCDIWVAFHDVNNNRIWMQGRWTPGVGQALLGLSRAQEPPKKKRK